MRTTTRDGLPVLRNLCSFVVALVLNPALGSIAPQVGQLTLLVNDLTPLASEQDAMSHAARRAAAKARERKRRLREKRIRPIVRLAKVLLRDDPERADAFRMSESKSYEEAMVAGLSLADRVEQYKATFVAAGLKEDFIDQLRSAVEDVRAALAEKAEFKSRRVRATAAIEEKYDRARDLVRYIDAVLVSELENDPVKLAEWRSVSKFPELDTSPPAPVVPVTDGGKPSTDNHAA
jgi:hypothetical protein